jgi:C1A family cysteine protease
MMFSKLLLLISSVFAASASASVSLLSVKGEVDEWDMFYDFQDKFSKKYDDVRELEQRFDIFRSNVRDMIAHNANETNTFVMDINQFSDMTAAEFKEERLGFVKNKHATRSAVGFGSSCSAFSGTGATLPDSIDWRTKGAVTGVKDQGQCGSCWSFSASGAMEGAWFISTGKLVSISEQELVDCAGIRYGSSGCNGGQMDGAFKFAIDNGICTESSYPYTSGDTQKDGTCQKCVAAVTIDECFDVKSNDQLALKEAVSKQPVAIAIEADTRYFQSYAGGVLTASTCGTTLDHGVLIVGYGTENEEDYWLIKNSWGTAWGDEGYMKMARNKGNMCGVASAASYPLV